MMMEDEMSNMKTNGENFRGVSSMRVAADGIYLVMISLHPLNSLELDSRIDTYLALLIHNKQPHSSAIVEKQVSVFHSKFRLNTDDILQAMCGCK